MRLSHPARLGEAGRRLAPYRPRTGQPRDHDGSREEAETPSRHLFPPDARRGESSSGDSQAGEGQSSAQPSEESSAGEGQSSAQPSKESSGGEEQPGEEVSQASGTPQASAAPALSISRATAPA